MDILQLQSNLSTITKTYDQTTKTELNLVYHKIDSMDYEANLEKRANELQRNLKHNKNQQIQKLIDEYFDLITNKMSNNLYDRNCTKELAILNKMKFVAQDESVISEKIIMKFIKENFRDREINDNSHY